MKLESNRFSFSESDDHIQQIFYDGKPFFIKTPKIHIPFGLDEYNEKYYIRLELFSTNEKDAYYTQHKHLKNIIQKIEKIIMKKMNAEEKEWKTVIRSKPGLPDLIECRVKHVKNYIQTKVEYPPKDKALYKTIYDLNNKSYGTAVLEIFGLWDYREDSRETNKIGLILNIVQLTISDE